RGIAAGNAVITYTVTTGSGCVSVDTAHIAVNALPEMEKSVGEREVCAGSSVMLTNGSTGGTGVWSSSNTGVATVDNNGLVRGIAAGNAVITYTVTTGSGCVSVDTAHVLVNALPEMEKSVGLREVCAGSAVALTNGSTGGTGVWSSSAVSVATIDNNGVVRGVSPGNAVITYTVITAKGCVSLDTAHVLVNALPEMEKSVGLREVCVGSTVTLTNGSTGGTGVWSSSNTGIATIDNNGVVRGLTAGSAVITYAVTTAKGCVSVDTAQVLVNALPEMEKSVGLREVCAGSSVTLTNGSTGGTGVWSSSAVSVATVDNNGVVRGVSAGSAVITYTVTTAKGCVSQDTAHIAVNALPEMEKSIGLREVCAGSSVTLTNGSTGGTGVWSSSAVGVATVDNNGLVRGVAAGSAVITYTVTTAKGCVSVDTAHIAVNALPEMENSVGEREVCAGSSVTLTNGSTGGTGVWSSSAVSVATVDNNGLVRGVAAGSVVITYTVTTAKGCVSVDTAHIAVNALPEMEKSFGAREVCAGSAVTLTNGSTGGTGVWSSSAVSVATIDNNGVVRGVAAGSVVITYTVITAKGCVSVDTAHIAVNALPEMEKSIGLREVCAGSSVTLTNSSTGGTGVWSSSAVGVATVDNNGLVRGVAAGSAVITYTVTTAKGCVSQDTAHIAVNALPEMEKSVGEREVCAGSAVMLTNSSTGGTGVWSSSAVSVATVDNNGVVRGVAAGNTVITYTVTTAKGCVSVDTAHIAVNALPEMEKSVGEREVCAGSSVTLTNGSTGGTGVWSSSAVSVATIDNNGVVRGLTAGNAVITYTVTTAKGCVSQDTAHIALNALPEMEKSIGTREVCAGSTVTLTNGSTGGTGVWSSSNTGIATIDNNGLVRGVAAGSAVITYTVTTAKGCVSVDTAHIAVNALPEMEKSVGAREVCAGSTVTLTNGSTGGTGVWSSSNTGIAIIDNNGLVRGVTAGNAVITYTVTTGSGCVSVDTAHIAVNALPEMEKSVGAREVCAGSSVTLTNGSTGGTGAWSSSNTVVATVDNNGVVRGVSAGSAVITYTVTTAKGCVSVDTAHIAVNALPEMEKSVGLREVCAGSSVTLTNGSTGGTGVWSSSAVSVATVDNNGLVRGVSAGSVVITYTVTTAKGCVSVDTAHIAVNALPEMEKSIGLREVCAGSTVTLTNSSTGGTGVWSSSAVSVATVDNNGLVRGVSAGNAVITYTVTTAKGCVSVDTARMTVNALPEMEKSIGAREVCAGSSVTLTNGSTGGTGVWSSSAVSVATIDNNGLVRGVAAGSAVITYTVTTAKGCVSVDTAHIAVNALPEMEKSVGAREVCAGSAVTLTNSSTGGTGVWISSAVSFAEVDNNGLVRGVAAGNAVITYTVTTAKGCVSVDTAHIAVNALPEMEKSVGLREVCAGSSVTLTNGSTGGTGVWSSSAVSVATIDNNGLVRGVAAGSAVITYTVTTAKGCVSVDTAHIAVNALPEMEKSIGLREVCAGSSVTLTNGSTGGTGVWSSSAVSVATVDNNGVVRGVAAGNAVIAYTVTTTKGCVSVDTAHIAVNALPEMEKSIGLREVCAGSAITLTNGSTGGTGVWSSNNIGVATIDHNGVVRGVSAGSSVITYIVTTGKGCVSLDTAHVL
ncbi:uncharacterized protein YjdB, partial [Filimonas zeae]|uniref:beta strand repeat-containing protein n=1 Tax=Filimonas zeae TaxID=1737353 RepID=UPI002855D7C6